MKLHELLHDALHFFELCEWNTDININMTRWFQWEVGSDRTRCSVCLAGAYFCRGVVVDPSVEESSLWENNELKTRLYALDSLRRGDVAGALEYFDITPPITPVPFVVASYKGDGAQFMRSMQGILDYLKDRDY